MALPASGKPASRTSQWGLLLLTSIACAVGMFMYYGVDISSFLPAIATWRTIHKQTPQSHGGGTRPSIRYGHSTASWGNKMIVTHGYYYNAAANQATWLSDTWAMDMSSHKWSLLSSGISTAEAVQSYRARGRTARPSGRFGQAAAVFNDTLFMYGGHDGGHSRHGRQNYESDYEFDELWAFSFRTNTWTQLDAKPDPALLNRGVSPASPGRRYLLSALVIDSQLIVYGGSMEGQGDVWALDLSKPNDLTWRLLAPEVPCSQGGPGRRVGTALLPITFPGAPKGFIMHSGRNAGAGKEDSGPPLLDDAWFFDLSTLTWRVLEMNGPAPAARRYEGHTHAYLSVPQPGALNLLPSSTQGESVFVGVTVGGSVDSPTHICSGESWAFTVDCGVRRLTWIRLPNIPYAIYEMQTAANRKSVFTFGGHLCKASRKDLPFSYTNQVWKLDLRPHLVPHLSRNSVCHVQGDPERWTAGASEL